MSKYKDKGSIIIDHFEILEMPFYLTHEQSVLSLLQDKGAPIEGRVYFKKADGFEWTETQDPLNHDIKVSWRKL